MLLADITRMSQNVVKIKMADVNAEYSINEPRHEKTNILVSNLVRHKPGCTATEDG